MGTYKELFVDELQRDPPIREKRLRRMVLREAQAREKRRRDHVPSFTKLEEQMLVGLLLEHDQASMSMTDAAFCGFVRGTNFNTTLRGCAIGRLRNWSLAFRKRRYTQLPYWDAQLLSTDRALAQDSVTVEAWFQGAALNSLRDENNRHITRTQQKTQKERNKRVARNRKRPIFARLCSDHGVDPNSAAEGEMFELSEQFDEAIADDIYKSQLQERCKKPIQSILTPRKTVEACLPGLLQKSAFKMLVVQTMGQLPSNHEGPGALHFVVDLYDCKFKEELLTLACRTHEPGTSLGST